MVQPNQKKLLIPRKGINDPTNLDIDWHEIEAWANAQQGGPQGPQGAQGPQGTPGGGGGAPGYGTVTAQMDSSIQPFAMWIGPTDISFTGETTLGPLQPSLAGAMHYTFATSWITETGVTASVNILPIFTMPPFSNPGTFPIEVGFYFNAMEIDASFNNFGFYSGDVSISSGATVQTTVGDLTPLFGGATGDLSLVAGTGTSGNGLVSASGTPLYIASVTGSVDVPANTTFP